MKKLKIEGTDINMHIDSCNHCPLQREVGPCGETWPECSITQSFASYDIPSNCPLPEGVVNEHNRSIRQRNR